MSKVVVRLRGMMVRSSSSDDSAGSLQAITGGASYTLAGQVREETLGHVHRFLLALGQVVYGAVGAVDVPATEVFLGDVVAHGVAHHRRPGDEELGDVAHHDREVAEHGLGRADADDAAQQHVHDGYGVELFGVHGGAEVAR